MRYLCVLLIVFLLTGCEMTPPIIRSNQDVYDIEEVDIYIDISYEHQGLHRQIRLEDYIELGIANEDHMELDWGGLGEGPIFVYNPNFIPEPISDLEPESTPIPESTPDPVVYQETPYDVEDNFGFPPIPQISDLFGLDDYPYNEYDEYTVNYEIPNYYSQYPTHDFCVERCY